MPVSILRQAEVQTETREAIEKRQQLLAEEIDDSRIADTVALNRLKEFLSAEAVWHISDMDYPMRVRYEKYLNRLNYAKGSIRKYIKVFDLVKQYEIAQQMKTLAGKQRYQWKYQNTVLFLPYHPDEDIVKQFAVTRQLAVLVWDFKRECPELLKRQVFNTLNKVIDTYKNRNLKRNKLLALQNFYTFCTQHQIEDVGMLEQSQIDLFESWLRDAGVPATDKHLSIIGFCRRVSFENAERIPWDATVWYLERFHLKMDRMNESNPVGSISFMEIQHPNNRKIAQAYMKYELGITGQAISTITRRYLCIRNFLEFLEQEGLTATECTALYIKQYAKMLLEKQIEPKGYNERLSGIGHFYKFMEVRQYIKRVPFRLEYHMQKVVPVHHDRSVEYEVYIEILQKLHKFPEHLRCMFLHLWCIGLRASEVCTLKGNAYYEQGADCWIQVYQVKMKSYKRVPIPVGLYRVMQVYLKKHQIQADDYIFPNTKGGAFLYQTFHNQMIKTCEENKITNGEYIFNSHDYRHTVATMFYDNQVSIQSIRDYLGHTYDEMTRQYIDYMPRKLAQANEEFFSHKENNLAACLKKVDTNAE